MSDFGRVFDDGIRRGVYTKTQQVIVMVFYSSEDDAWFAQLQNSPGLNTFGETPADALRQFCVMLPAALESGLSMEDFSVPFTRLQPKEDAS